MFSIFGLLAFACLTLALVLALRAEIVGGAKQTLSQRRQSGRVGQMLFRSRDGERDDLSRIDTDALEKGVGRMNSLGGSLLKRCIDVSVSIAMLVLLAPLLLVTALAIKFDSRGPVLYKQARVGKNGSVFNVYKFRSMYADAERDGPQYAQVRDSRITRVGHIIRHFRIDEIPQTLNVLRGDMSFVGPRPERPEFVATLEQEIPHYQARHLVKPGITGWAQVRYEYAASVEGAREKLRYDLYYLRNYSIWLDIAIVMMTVRVAIFGLGSR